MLGSIVCFIKLAFNKGLSRSIKQARQFIIHGHIAVDNAKLDCG